MTGLFLASQLFKVRSQKNLRLHFLTAKKLKPHESQHEFRFFENGCGTDFLDVQMFGSWLNEQGDAFQLQFKNFAFPGQYSGGFPNRPTFEPMF